MLQPPTPLLPEQPQEPVLQPPMPFEQLQFPLLSQTQPAPVLLFEHPHELFLYNEPLQYVMVMFLSVFVLTDFSVTTFYAKRAVPSPQEVCFVCKKSLIITKIF